MPERHDEKQALEATSMTGKEVSRREFLRRAGIAGAVLAVGGGLGGALTACGASTTTTSVAGSTGSSGGNTNTAAHEQALEFAQCMRDNGVSQFPDPSASGAFTIENIANGSSLDTTSAAFKKALSACKDLEPPGFTGAKRSATQQEAALKFSQCIRDNGVKDFPDPGPTDPLIDTTRIPSAATAGGMSILHAAMKKCSGYATSAGVTGGGNQ